MVLNVHRNRTAYWGRGERGYGGGGGVGREIVYISLPFHHQNDFYIKMGSDESHFNVSVGSDGQSHKTVSTLETTTFLKKKESRNGIEPRSFRLPAYRLTARPDRLSEGCTSGGVYVPCIYTHAR